MDKKSKQKIVQIVGIVAILAGLLFALNIVSFAVLVVDDTAPVIASTVPSNGQTLPKINSISALVWDLESGVQEVDVELYNSSGALIHGWVLVRTSGTEFNGTYSVSFADFAVYGKNYWIHFLARNKAGLISIRDVYITIYTDLQGKWYINNQEVTSTTQTIYSTSLTVEFKFIKTSGISDNYITCSVWDTMAQYKLFDLTYQGSGTWAANYTFARGSYYLDLKASDGTRMITMSIVDLAFQQETPVLQFSRNQLFGVCLMGVGVILIAVLKRR